MFHSDRLPHTTHQSQFFFQSSLFFFPCRSFKIAWYIRLKLDFWLGNKIIARKGSLWNLIDRKHGSIDSNNDVSKKDRHREKVRWSGEGGSSSFWIDIDISMLAYTNYRLIIKLTASIQEKSGWFRFTFDFNILSTFCFQMHKREEKKIENIKSTDWKSCRYTSPETILCRSSKVSRATNKRFVFFLFWKRAAISNRALFGLVKIIIYAFIIIIIPNKRKTLHIRWKLVRKIFRSFFFSVKMRNFCSLYVMDETYIQLSLNIVLFFNRTVEKKKNSYGRMQKGKRWLFFWNEKKNEDRN